MLQRIVLFMVLFLGAVYPYAFGAERAVPNEFKTIQAAIDAANEGDTVAVAPGRYTETLKLKPAVSLKGADKGQVIVTPADPKAPALTISHCPSGEMSNITFDGGAKPGSVIVLGAPPLCLIADSTITVHDCVFQQSLGDGLRCEGKGSSTLARCAALGNTESGIVVADSSATITDVESLKNGEDGITCKKQAFVRVDAAICTQNGYSGIHATGRSTIAYVNRTTCSNNRRMGLVTSSLGVIQGSENTYVDNDLTSNVEVGWLMKKNDFKSLEAMAARYRAQARPTAGWQSPLGSFYGALAAPCDDATKETEAEFLDNIAAWRKAAPKSVTPLLALALGYRNLAWRERGGGWANTVTDDGWKGFHSYLGKSWAALDEARTIDPKEPEYLELVYDQSFDDPKAETSASPLSFVPIVQIARLLLGHGDPLEALFKQSVDMYPLYLPLYGARVRTLMPRWGGSEQAMVKFAESSAESTRALAGDGLYTHVAFSTYTYEGEDNFLSDYKFAWDRIRQGMDDIETRFSANQVIRNFCCRLACLQKDQATAAKLFRKIGGHWNENYFASEYEFDRWRQWAYGQAPYPSPSPLEKAIVAKDVDGCRRRA